jgi:NitT/TauT family transport system substrate-binding protein
MLRKIFVFCFCFSVFSPSAVFAADDSKNLRMALLPVPDVLPIYLAQEKGYFSEAGITVETLPVGSAIERDQLMQAGRIDGMINELSGAANFNRDAIQVQVVSIARSPIGGAPLFRILAAPGSGLNQIADLANVPIGISVNTVIEYISDRLLAAGGVSSEAIEYKSIPVLPERLQLLLSGQVKAVTLPDPLAASAIAAGAVEIVNDASLAGISASVITFSSKSLTEKNDTVKKFMAAWDKATADLNTAPGDYKELMLKKIRVPRNIRASFTIPPFPRKALPTKDQWQDVMDWMVKKKLLSKPLTYEGSVTPEYLAK